MAIHLNSRASSYSYAESDNSIEVQLAALYLAYLSDSLHGQKTPNGQDGQYGQRGFEIHRRHLLHQTDITLSRSAGEWLNRSRSPFLWPCRAVKHRAGHDDHIGIRQETCTISFS